jgi:hypothetical protein
VNTAREHVEGLLEVDLVERERRPPPGAAARSGATRPGSRPRRRPLATTPPSPRPWPGTSPAHVLHPPRTPPRPVRTGGRALASGRPAPQTSLQARWDVVGRLGAAGFAPRADDETRTVHLRRRPILGVARQYPQIVCNVHRGLVTAALETLGAVDDARQVELFCRR